MGSTSGVRPNLTATPEVTAPLNLANYVPKLREVNQALAKIDGGISFGPTAHLQYPVTFNFDSPSRAAFRGELPARTTET